MKWNTYILHPLLNGINHAVKEVHLSLNSLQIRILSATPNTSYRYDSGEKLSMKELEHEEQEMLALQHDLREIEKRVTILNDKWWMPLPKGDDEQ